MKKYMSEQEAIVDLHERGYCQDFQLYGDDLFWLQEKVFINAGEFSILECYRFCNPCKRRSEIIVFGVIAIYYNAKSILINRHSGDDTKSPLLINDKNWKSCPQPKKNYHYTYSINQISIK